MAAVLYTTPVFAQKPPPASPSIVSLVFNADVRIDGTLANVQPDKSLTPALQAMVIKRVAEWRYQVGSWQGKPAPMPISQMILAEVVPVSSGGFVLRMQKITSVPSLPTKKMYPPEYPLQARKNGVTGTFIYAVRADAQGKPYDIELLVPEHQDKDMKTLEHAARAAMAKWTLDAIQVDGAPIDCRRVIPIQFALGPNPERDKPDLAPYRARYVDVCPAYPELITKVVGTVL